MFPSPPPPLVEDRAPIFDLDNSWRGHSIEFLPVEGEKKEREGKKGGAGTLRVVGIHRGNLPDLQAHEN